MRNVKAFLGRASRARRLGRVPALLALVLGASACSGEGAGDACEIEDQDGIIGGMDVFMVTITDDGFEPPVLNAQNQSNVTLTLVNDSSAEAGFLVDCLPTPNDDGCPQESCFPDSSTIEPIAPGESAMAEFELPEVEGEYIYRTLPDDDERTGQLILQ